MALVERMVHYTNAPTDKILAKEKRYDAAEARIGGFPPKKRMRVVFGKETMQTFVWEREWKDLAAMQEAYSKSNKDPEVAEIHKMEPDLGPSHWEIYWLMED